MQKFSQTNYKSCLKRKEEQSRGSNRGEAALDLESLSFLRVISRTRGFEPSESISRIKKFCEEPICASDLTSKPTGE